MKYFSLPKVKGEHVLVQMVEKVEEKTESGLIIERSDGKAKQNIKIAKVISSHLRQIPVDSLVVFAQNSGLHLDLGSGIIALPTDCIACGAVNG